MDSENEGRLVGHGLGHARGRGCMSPIAAAGAIATAPGEAMREEVEECPCMLNIGTWDSNGDIIVHSVVFV